MTFVFNAAPWIILAKADLLAEKNSLQNAKWPQFDEAAGDDSSCIEISA